MIKNRCLDNIDKHLLLFRNPEGYKSKFYKNRWQADGNILDIILIASRVPKDPKRKMWGGRKVLNEHVPVGLIEPLYIEQRLISATLRRRNLFIHSMIFIVSAQFSVYANAPINGIFIYL